MRTFIFSLALCAFLTFGGAAAGQTQQPDWTAFDEETMRHYQTLLRFDTTDPPGNEKPTAEDLQSTHNPASPTSTGMSSRISPARGKAEFQGTQSGSAY